MSHHIKKIDLDAEIYITSKNVTSHQKKLMSHQKIDFDAEIRTKNVYKEIGHLDRVMC